MPAAGMITRIGHGLRGVHGLSRLRSLKATVGLERVDSGKIKFPAGVSNFSQLRKTSLARNISSTKQRPRERAHPADYDVVMKRPRQPNYYPVTSLGEDVYQTTDSDVTIPAPLLPEEPDIAKYLEAAGTLFVDKTRYIEILDKRPNYQYMFLRPRRFGKSTVLSMLAWYYDIATPPETWNHIFGSLYIGKNPTPYRQQHMVLLLDLSTIVITENTEEKFNAYMFDVLSNFLEKYGERLGDFNPNEILSLANGTKSLQAVLRLVKKAGYTLFVGIDEYDSPANSAAFDGTGPQNEQKRLEKVSQIEQLFNHALFATFKLSAGAFADTACISKYFITGVLPAFRATMSPLNATKIISNSPEFSGLCGLNKQQVRLIAENYLGWKDSDETLDGETLDGVCFAMQKYYNGYNFAYTKDMESSAVYNPLFVYHYLQGMKISGEATEPTPSPLIHNTNILASISDTGDFSVEDIVDLAATGYIRSKVRDEFGYGDLVTDLGKDKTVTISLLVHLGILTRSNKSGLFKIPNLVMKEDVLERIMTYLQRQTYLQQLRPANHSLCSGSIEPFAKLLEEFMKCRALRSLSTTNEATLQAIIEIMLDPPKIRIPELRLVMDGARSKADGRYGFVDMVVCHNSGNTIILELKDIRLGGLLSAQKDQWLRKPEHQTMHDFADELSRKDVHELRDMPYWHWSDRKLVKTTVGQIEVDAIAQLKRYMQVMKTGPPRDMGDSGVLDQRVKTTNDPGALYGFVVVAVGGRRVLWQSVNTVEMDFSYQCV